MCGGTPSAPTPPPALPEAPTLPEARGEDAGASDKRRRRAAAGQGQSTILTGPQGIQNGAATAQKSLLGQ